MNAFFRWITSVPGVFVVTVLCLAAMAAAPDPRLREAFAYVGWMAWMLPLARAGATRRCRTPRWLGGR